MIRSHSALFKIILSFVVGLLVCQPVSSATAIDEFKRYSDTALDQLDGLINASQIREIKKQFQKTTNFLINPYFKTGFDFTSNVYRAPIDGTPDEIWTFTPGVTVTGTPPGASGRFGLSYEADFRVFSHQHKQNEQDQRFAALADIEIAENVFFRASERLTQAGATAGRKGLEPVDYLDNTVNGMISYKRGPWTWEAGYENFVRNYQHQLFDRLDYNDNRVITRMSSQVAEHFKQYLEFHAGQVDFPDVSTRDANYFQILPGIEGEFPGIVSVAANVGYHRRNLEKDARNNLDMVVTSVVLKKQFQPRTSGEAAFTRGPQEGSFDAQTFYVGNSWYAGLIHLFTRKLRGKTGVTFSSDSYQGSATVGGVTVKRRDNAFGFNVGLDYAARQWFVLHIAYLLQRRDSNISDFDYTENRLSLGLTVPV